MKYLLDYKNETIEVQAENVKGKLWLHFDGQTFCIEPTENNFRKSKNQGPNSNQIISPMPGKVTKILKQPGDSVNKGDTVLVMEAMKMEYTLKSGCNGKLEKILIAVNDQVGVGKILATLEESK